MQTGIRATLINVKRKAGLFFTFVWWENENFITVNSHSLLHKSRKTVLIEKDSAAEVVCSFITAFLTKFNFL